MVQLWEAIRIFAILRTADAVSRHFLTSQKDNQHRLQLPPIQRLLAERLLTKLHQAPMRSLSKPQESTNTASKATPSTSKK